MTISEVLKKLPSPEIARLPAPTYEPPMNVGPRIACAVPSMQRHMSDEGWQIMLALQSAGYDLAGHRLGAGTNLADVVAAQPSVVVLQDKREWDAGQHLAQRQERFFNTEALHGAKSVFKLTILKDSHQRPHYHADSAEEIGCHAWIVYYHPAIVHHLAPYVRREHLVRTYHSIDPVLVPAYSEMRDGCLVSGAISSVYPLRQRLARYIGRLPGGTYLQHPGYHNRATNTPSYLQLLSRFKVAICTSSQYGYALRKIVEATAAGCMVVTNLPSDEVLPEIDANLIRLDSSDHYAQCEEVINRMPQWLASYDPVRQAELAEKAKTFYDYKLVGQRLADDIEQMRRNYVS